MLPTPDKLLVLASNLEELASDLLEKTADKHQKGLGNARQEHEEWAKKNPPMSKWKDKDWSEYLKKKSPDSNKAKDKKLDPKAKVRNRGTVCVPASEAKDKQDHFPINDEDQARNALARVHQYSKVPSWYNGSLKGLQDLVSRKVHSKYKGIGKDKKSSVDYLLTKYANPQAFYQVVMNYDNGATALKDFSEALRMSAETFAQENDLDDPSNRRTYDLLSKQAHLVLSLLPDMEKLDQELDQGDSGSQEAPVESV